MAAILGRRDGSRAAAAHGVELGRHLADAGGRAALQAQVGRRDRRYRYFVKLNDRALLDERPAALTDRFTGFYVVPFSSLRSEGAVS